MLLVNSVVSTFVHEYAVATRPQILRDDVSAAEVALASTRSLFYGNLFQAMWLVLLFWVDILPWFGASSDLTSFWNNLVFSLSCRSVLKV
jgi:hypothetical protein